MCVKSSNPQWASVVKLVRIRLEREDMICLSSGDVDKRVILYQHQYRLYLLINSKKN